VALLGVGNGDTDISMIREGNTSELVATYIFSHWFWFCLSKTYVLAVVKLKVILYKGDDFDPSKGLFIKNQCELSHHPTIKYTTQTTCFYTLVFFPTVLLTACLCV
jgi:hypothetical protein